MSAEVTPPVKVSADGRFFTDQTGKPVFWLGDTQWELTRSFSLDDARTILADRAAKGFAYVQVMLYGVGDGLAKNLEGEAPWRDVASLAPHEAYFRRVDEVIRIAGELGVTISLTVFHQRYRGHITLDKARAYARGLAERWRDAPNLVWSMTPEASEEFVPILRELAAGLKQGDGGRHLITFKPDPAPFTSSFLHEEPWLDFNCMQVWKQLNLIAPFIALDYGLTPVKPVVMAEGAYEAGTEYGFDVTPLWVRRQAWYSYLAGAHHTYGHNDSWRVLPTWRSALDAPGARQMAVLKRVLTARAEWWNLVPDRSLLARGGRAAGDVLHLAARHRDGRWAVVYLAAPATVALAPGRIAYGATPSWVDPRSGDALPAGPPSGPFTTPAGWEDALLVCE